MTNTDTLEADDEAFGDTIQDTLNLSDSAQLREDAKFHEMTRLVKNCCPRHWPPFAALVRIVAQRFLTTKLCVTRKVTTVKVA